MAKIKVIAPTKLQIEQAQATVGNYLLYQTIEKGEDGFFTYFLNRHNDKTETEQAGIFKAISRTRFSIPVHEKELFQRRFMTDEMRAHRDFLNELVEN